MNDCIRVCCVSSHGGHLHELSEAVKDVIGSKCWITYRTKHTRNLLKNKRHHFIIDPVTSKLKFLINAIQSFAFLLIERPEVIISTGAGIAIPTMILGKYLLGSKIIYIESAAAVEEPSKTGRFMYKYADLFLIQWETLRQFYPKAKYVGIL